MKIVSAPCLFCRSAVLLGPTSLKKLGLGFVPRSPRACRRQLADAGTDVKEVPTPVVVLSGIPKLKRQTLSLKNWELECFVCEFVHLYDARRIAQPPLFTVFKRDLERCFCHRPHRGLDGLLRRATRRASGALAVEEHPRGNAPYVSYISIKLQEIRQDYINAELQKQLWNTS